MWGTELLQINVVPIGATKLFALVASSVFCVGTSLRLMDSLETGISQAIRIIGC